MYCSNCGQKINDNATVCQQCGNSVESHNISNQPKAVEDKPNPGYSLLSFFIPIFGIAMYFAERKTKPKASNIYLVWSFVSIGLIVLFYVVYIAAIVVMVAVSSNM